MEDVCFCQEMPSDLNSTNDFQIRLKKVAGLFLELLEASKLFNMQLSSINYVCEIAKFIKGENDLHLFGKDRKEQQTQTRLVLNDFILNNDKHALNNNKSNWTDMKPISDKKRSRKKSKAINNDTHSDTGTKCLDIISEVNTNNEKNQRNETLGVSPVNSIFHDKSQLKCNICGKYFASKRNLNAHSLIHKKNKDYDCRVCDKKFSSSQQLFKHKKVHETDKHHTCEVCGSVFDSVANLSLHREETHELSQQSQASDKHFTRARKNQSSIKTTNTTKTAASTITKRSEKNKTWSHDSDENEEKSEMTETSQETDQFICNICKKSMNNKAALVAHMKRHMTASEFHCEFCQKEFMNLEDLQTHRKEHTGERPYTCDVCGKQFKTQGSIRCHMATHTGRHPYKCDICGKSYTQTSGLNLHKLKHTAEEEKNSRSQANSEQYKCDICGRTYKTKYRLTLHAKIHESKREWQCDFCEKKFYSAHDRAVHQRSHTNDKYTCRVCGASFKSRSTYYFHSRTHPANKPHLCSVCGKSFTRIYDLKTHKRKHNETTETLIEQHACDVCGKVYQMKNNLKIHMKIHLGIFDHPCDFCEKKFKSHAELRHHRRVHTLEKPYTCETCNKSFSRQSTLVNHRRTHSGERPYLCMTCGAAFKLSCTLKKHQKVHIRESQGKGRGKARVASPAPVRKMPSPPPLQDDDDDDNSLAPLVHIAPPDAMLQLSEEITPQVTVPAAIPQVTLRDLQTHQSLIVTHDIKNELSTLLQADTTAFLHHHQQQQNQLRAAAANIQLHPQFQAQNFVNLTNTPTIAIATNVLQMQDPSVSTDLYELRADSNGGLTAIRTLINNGELELQDPTRELHLQDPTDCLEEQTNHLQVHDPPTPLLEDSATPSEEMQDASPPTHFSTYRYYYY